MVIIAIGIFTGWRASNAATSVPLAISQNTPFPEQIAQFLPELPPELKQDPVTLSETTRDQSLAQQSPGSSGGSSAPVTPPIATRSSIAALQKLAPNAVPNVSNKTLKIPNGTDSQKQAVDRSISLIARRYHPIAKAAGYVEIYPEATSAQLVSYQGQQLQVDAAKAFEQMRTAAAADGIKLNVVSGFRSLQTQVQIFDGKGGGLPAAEYSAPPGHSQHHTGLAIDINSLKPSFRETKAFAWLRRHASSYGFILPYVEDSIDLGPKAEPWHWVYVGKPSAMKLMAGFLQRARQNSYNPLLGDRKLEAIYRSSS
jgi:LAS superfamily LD-carboxypeptidase LdcB